MDRLQRPKRKQFLRPNIWALLLLSCSLKPQTAMAAAVEEIDLFGGIAGGYTHIVPDDGGETSKNGYHLLLSGFGEIATADWVWQAGGGIFYNRIYSDGEKQFPGSQANTVRQQENLRIETRAGEAEFAGRYKLTGSLEAGLLFRALFGSSLSFSQDKDYATKFFAGPQLVLRMGQDADWLKRIDINLLTDFNVPQRRVYLLTAGFAIGKAFRYPKEPSPPAPLPVPPPAPIPPPPPAPVAENRFEEILADKVINFASGSSEVQGTALGFLKELGGFLKANPELWREIDVEGHTDANGKLAYNMKLSKDRAHAVRNVLIANGAAASKVKAEGFGPTRPLVKEDSDEARATNRRVVMAFSVTGKDQRTKLSAKIKELRKKYFNE